MQQEREIKERDTYIVRDTDILNYCWRLLTKGCRRRTGQQATRAQGDAQGGRQGAGDVAVPAGGGGR